MDAKHTPGPWMVQPFDDNEDGCSVIAVDPEIGMRSPRRGQVAWCTTIAGAAFESPGRAIANARLISAAPDLLEALQVAELILRERGLRAHGGYKQIESAIAKATGAHTNDQ